MLGLTAVLAYLNVYFLLLIREDWAGAAKRLGGLARGCGIDTSSCAIVVRTGWARLAFGMPNTVVGLAWCGVLGWLAVSWLVTGVLVVPVWALVVALGTVAAAAVLIWALLVPLKQPCPL